MGMLDFRNVSKSFGEGTHETPVLKNIDLSVEEGEFLVLLGFSGTGKTTLINLMAGLEFPTRGEVTFKGKPITGPGPERGVIFQSDKPGLRRNINDAPIVLRKHRLGKLLRQEKESFDIDIKGMVPTRFSSLKC